MTGPRPLAALRAGQGTPSPDDRQPPRNKPSIDGHEGQSDVVRSRCRCSHVEGRRRQHERLGIGAIVDHCGFLSLSRREANLAASADSAHQREGGWLLSTNERQAFHRGTNSTAVILNLRYYSACDRFSVVK